MQYIEQFRDLDRALDVGNMKKFRIFRPAACGDSCRTHYYAICYVCIVCWLRVLSALTFLNMPANDAREHPPAVSSLFLFLVPASCCLFGAMCKILWQYHVRRQVPTLMAQTVGTSPWKGSTIIHFIVLGNHVNNSFIVRFLAVHLSYSCIIGSLRTARTMFWCQQWMTCFLCAVIDGSSTLSNSLLLKCVSIYIHVRQC